MACLKRSETIRATRKHLSTVLHSYASQGSLARRLRLQTERNICRLTHISFSQSDSDGTEFEEILQDDIASPEQLLIEKEKFKEFKEQLWNKLSNMEKKVLQLYLEGNNYTSIARMLGKSDKSIDNALSRIRQKLKRK